MDRSRMKGFRWAMVALAITPAGCAYLFPDRARPIAPPGSPSTLGHDLRALPRGEMVGPPGLGIDLARSSSKPGRSRGPVDPKADPDAVTASVPDVGAR